MEHVHCKSSGEQYGVRPHKVVMKFEDTCTDAVIHIGRYLYVGKDLSFHWVDEHSVQPGGVQDRA